MKFSVALIGVGFIFVAFPKLNEKIDLVLKDVPYVQKIRARIATLSFFIGFLGLLMDWF